ncbi:T9SS type A sorting domain-containing protein [Flavobacterium sp. LC2016-01]|uniref:T9SS type A sorting domain-containing protein n=1 Tax=Flavobacterium sp. LC2016-01 TaxID=2675876 RepID=UPI0012BB1914|nr:T9SS type A sorting domain-containing protein [Flavobacterium sp. LC2016-01]MTH15276.1 T9SS type A sorting domain-containing protein [Flavobacterium sp. LC2016-01]
MKTKLLLLLLLANFSIYAQTNLVTNGNFETRNGNNQPTNWTAANSAYLIYGAGQGYYSLYLYYNTLSPKVTTQVPMKAGVTYTIKFKYKYASSNYSGDHPISLQISQTGSASSMSSSTLATNNSWTQKEITFTADSNLSYDLSFSTFSFDGKPFEVYIDAVQVYEKGTEQYTSIPNLNFEKKLITLGYDTEPTDGRVATIDIADIINLDVSNSSITDLTGIQDFSSLINLNCGQTGLTSLDVSKNKNLTILDCHNNGLKTLDISKNTNLTFLTCESNYLQAIDVRSNIALQYLNCGNNGGNNAISSLDLSQNVNLLQLHASGQKLTSIDLSKNTALQNLNLNNNNLTSLDLSSNPNLQVLLFSNNKLTTLDVSKNKLLQYLHFNSNQITSLDLSQHTALISLNCSNNKMKSLNLKNGNNSKFDITRGVPFQDMGAVMALPYQASFLNNTDLTCIQVDDANYSNSKWSSIKNDFTYFNTNDCSLSTIIADPKFEDKLIALKIDNDGKNGSVLNSSINTVTSLDVSNSSITDLRGIEGFKALKNLNASGNALKKLDISKNLAINTLNTSGNATLTCIQVADVAATANWSVTKDATTSFNLDCNVYTLIPDPNFENYLISQSIDRDGQNGKVLTEIIEKVTSLYLDGKNISDLTGIQDFKALTSLDANGNKFTEINLSKNTALTYLNLSINVLESLNLSKNTALVTLYIDSGKLSTIDLTKNTELKTLNIARNKLTNIDVSQNTKLTTLYVQGNLLSALDVSKNLELASFYCFTNQIRTLDLSKNTKLTTALADENKLVNFSIKNGNNALLNSFSVVNNPNLTCVQVDDVTYANKNWTTKKDATATYSATQCPTVIAYTLIPDPKFEEKLIDLGIDTDGKNGKVESMKIASLTSLNVSGSTITDLTGIEDFVALTLLECNDNQLKTLNVSKNVLLAKLNASKNQLTTLDVNNNTFLTDLNISNNTITSLSTANNKELSRLNFSNNNIRFPDFKYNTKLTVLNASFNKITTLDVSKNTMLKEFDCASNDLYNLNLKNGNNANMQRMIFGNFTQNPNLLCIQVDDVAFSEKNWIAKDAIANYSSVECRAHTGYTTIPDSKFEDKLIALKIDIDGKNGKVATMSIDTVTSLNISKSEISDLTGIAGFALLTTLDCSENSLAKIDLSKNLALTNVNVTKNNLSVLDVSKNTKLAYLSASFNKIENLDVSKNTSLKELDCAGNNMYNLNLKNGNNVNMQRVIFGNFTENPNLLCIQVDDAAFSEKNWIAKDATATYSTDACPVNLRYTLIPDLNFEKLLIEKNIDKDGENGKVLTANISNITYLNLNDSTRKVADLTGIQDFNALTTLYCYSATLTAVDLSKNINLTTVDLSNNKITAADFSTNTKLTSLVIYNNQLTALDLSKNTALNTLNVYNNKLSSIDLSKNTALTSIDLSVNQLNTIDIQTNTALAKIDISTNQLTAVNISANTNLTNVNVANNQLASINVSKNTLLKELRVNKNKIENIDISNLKSLTLLLAGDNQISTLDISQNTELLNLQVPNNKLSSIDISVHPALTVLDVSKNQLKTFDIRKNPALVSFYANENQLTSLDMRNGKNTLIQNYNLSLLSNPKLYCILVDDVTFSNTNWSIRKDAIAKFNTECTGELTLPVNNFAIETKGETCLGENNGEISINAKQTFAYVATINGKATAFTNNALKVTALTPGNYTITITIPGEIFEQNFNVTIQKGATITGKSSVNAKKVDVEITEGTAPFTVFIDGQAQFQTNDSNFSLDLEKGGLLEVATSKACEGVYSKKIATLDLYGTLAAYPNPTSGSFEIEIPTKDKEVTIELYNFGGQLVSARNYIIENGKVQLSLENQPSGIYAAKIYFETPEYIKIIKK